MESLVTTHMHQTPYTPATKVIFDCDPGVDDALALSLLLSCHPRCTLLGVTTVCGNTSVKNGTTNALALLEHARYEQIPVAQGCHTYLGHEFDGGVPHIHGATGSGEVTLSTTLQPHTLDAADFIIQTVHAHPHEIDLIAVGPLTNIATALRRDPEVAKLVRHLHIMGGVFWQNGNVSPDGEANIFHDVEAAAQVFAAPWSGFVAPLDATLNTYFEPIHLNQLASSSSRHAQLLARIADFYCHFYETCTGRFGCSLHDPLAVGAALGVVQPADVVCGTITVDTCQKTYGRTRLWQGDTEIHPDSSTTKLLPQHLKPTPEMLNERGVWQVIAAPQHNFPQILADHLCQLP